MIFNKYNLNALYIWILHTCHIHFARLDVVVVCLAFRFIFILSGPNTKINSFDPSFHEWKKSSYWWKRDFLLPLCIFFWSDWENIRMELERWNKRCWFFSLGKKHQKECGMQTNAISSIDESFNYLQCCYHNGKSYLWCGIEKNG